MKVLIVFNHPAPYKIRLFNELSSEIDLTLIFERKKESLRPDAFYNINEYKFKTIFLTHGSFGNMNSYSSEIKKYILSHHQEYDLIIMNGYSTVAEMKAISMMKKKHIPFVQFINGGIIKNDFFIKKWLKKKFLGNANYYLSPCEEADQYLIHYGAKKEAIFHYPYSTFYSKDILINPCTEEEKKKIRTKYHLPDGKLFVNPSLFIKRKNNMQLIRLFKNRSDALLLIGSGNEEKKYRSYIKKNHLNNIYILPFLKKDELFSLLPACDATVTLSKEDIYGHTINEGFACGLPAISSNNVISALHLIKNGENGFVVNLKNEQGITNALDSISSSMRESSLITAQENTVEKSALTIKKILKELTNK